jgi:hypothetical protein
MVSLRVRGSVTEIIGSWIGWLDLLTPSFTISFNYNELYITDHNRWLLKTRSIPYWTTSAFSSTMTDLVLIYEPVTSTIDERRNTHDFTFTNDDCTLTEFSSDSVTTEPINLRILPLQLRDASNREQHFHTLLRAYPVPRKGLLASRCLAMDDFSSKIVPAFSRHVTLLMVLHSTYTILIMTFTPKSYTQDLPHVKPVQWNYVQLE